MLSPGSVIGMGKIADISYTGIPAAHSWGSLIDTHLAGYIFGIHF